MLNPTTISNPKGLLFVHIPTITSPTRSIAQEDDETVSKKILPKDLRQKISHVDRIAKAIITTHLVKFARGLYFVAPPIATRLPKIKEAISNWKQSFADIENEILTRWGPDIQPRISAFESRYGRTININAADVTSRFRPEVTWMPFLPKGLEKALKSEEEIRKMQADFEAKAKASIEQKVENLMESLETLIEKAISQVSPKKGKARKVNVRTLDNIKETTKNLADILDGSPLLPIMESITTLNSKIGKADSARNTCDKGPKKNLDSSLSALLDSMNDVKKASKTLIANVKQEQQPPKEEPTGEPQEATPAPPPTPTEEAAKKTFAAGLDFFG